MSTEALDLLRQAQAGEGESEIIKLKLVPLEDLWREAPDSKALSALYLYDKFLALKPTNSPPISPLQPEQEKGLRELVKTKQEKKDAKDKGKGKDKDQEMEDVAVGSAPKKQKIVV